jgi:hypothetical protein
MAVATNGLGGNMWRNVSLLSVAASGVLSVCSTAAGATPIRYDCDTAAGAFSLIDFTQPGPDYRVTGRFSAVKFRNDPQWGPVATVQLVSADQKHAVGIRLRGKNARTPVDLLLQTLDGSGERLAALGTLPVGDWAPFGIEVAGGKITVRAAGRSLIVDAPIGAGATVKISCSSGEFQFDQLDWDAPAAR